MKDAAAWFIAQGTVGAVQGWLDHPGASVRSFQTLYEQLVPDWWGSR